jgi:hypothetical protein
VIAGHLRTELGFAPQDRLLLAYPVQNGPHRKGLPGGWHLN